MTEQEIRAKADDCEMRWRRAFNAFEAEAVAIDQERKLFWAECRHRWKDGICDSQCGICGMVVTWINIWQGERDVDLPEFGLPEEE